MATVLCLYSHHLNIMPSASLSLMQLAHTLFVGCPISRTTYTKYEAGQLNIRASVLIELKKSMDVPMMISSLD